MLKIVAGASLIAWLVPTAALAGGGGADRRRAPAPTDFRLHATATAKATPLVDAPGGQLRTGFGNGQVELYPFAGSGFHLSAGGRLYGRTGRPRNDNEQARLLAGTRGTGLRSGRRSSPAALVGIARNVGDGLALGVDGGAALGRLDNAPSRLRLSGHEGGGDGRVNEVGRVTMRYRF
jgi:hypothetical protein